MVFVVAKKLIRLNSDYFLVPNVNMSMDPIHKELLKEAYCVLRLSNSEHTGRIRTEGVSELGSLGCCPVSEIVNECTDRLPAF